MAVTVKVRLDSVTFETNSIKVSVSFLASIITGSLLLTFVWLINVLFPTDTIIFVLFELFALSKATSSNLLI